MKLIVATCQFPVSSDLRSNRRYVLRQMRTAKERGAHVAHFCEGALSGYAEADFRSHDGFDWDLLRECAEEVLILARRLKIWVLLGASHRLSRGHKPHNSVYIIDDCGKIVDRYDKRFCAGDRSGRTGELAHYSPGDHASVFSIRGIRCGVLICHEYRYPELYREYKKKGIELVFHSFHAGNVPPERLELMRAQVGEPHHRLNRGSTLPEITMPASMQAAAASSHVWISCSNTSARESCWPGFFVRPDGVITGRLRSNTAGVLLSTVDTRQRLYDSTVAWRDRAMRGPYHTGTLVRDGRSRARKEL
jgi:predicted amidohydrolase